MRKMISWGGWGIASLLLVHAAWGAQLEWLDKSTVVVDNVFQINKPGPKWDTQKTKDDPNAPVQWILHQAGRNPAIKFSYRTNKMGLMGKTTIKYAEQVRSEYNAKGILIQSVENKTINGRPVSLLHGLDLAKKEHYLIGVWRHQDKGFVLECSAKDKDFAGLMPEFHGVINTARILKKQ